jgi:hypothetical protein
MFDVSSQGTENDTLPSAAEVKNDIVSSQVESAEKERGFLEIFREHSVSGEREYVHLRGLSDHYRHKGFWSYFIASLMFVMIAFQTILLCLVGSGIWSFEKYTWLFPALLVQNLGQIVGLALFVVKALFKEMTRD